MRVNYDAYYEDLVEKANEAEAQRKQEARDEVERQRQIQEKKNKELARIMEKAGRLSREEAAQQLRDKVDKEKREVENTLLGGIKNDQATRESFTKMLCDMNLDDR